MLLPVSQKLQMNQLKNMKNYMKRQQQNHNNNKAPILVWPLEQSVPYSLFPIQ